MSVSVFISYSSNDKPFVKRFASDLQSRGVKVWVDDWEINIGDSLVQKIRAGIDDVEYLAVVLSPSSVKSAWVQKEVDIAINQEIEGKKVKVLPLLLKQCELPGFLKGKSYADFTSEEKYYESLQKVLRKFGADKIPSILNAESELFLDLVNNRLKGTRSIASKLYNQINSEKWSEATCLELAYHEFSRLGEHKALPTLNKLQGKTVSDPFILRSFILLQSLCYIARNEIDTVRHLINNAPSPDKISRSQRAYLALNEGIVFLSLSQPHEADITWKNAAKEDEKVFQTEAPYPPFFATKVFDRALIKVVVGVEPIEKIVEQLPFSLHKGLAHQSAVTARVMRKCDEVIRTIEKYGEESKWEHLPKFNEMKVRLREYEVILLSNSGTIFPSKVPI